MKNIIILYVMLLWVAISAIAENITIKYPIVDRVNNSEIVIKEISLTDSGTVMVMCAYAHPNKRMRVSADAYLLVNKKRYPVTKAEGVVLGKDFKMPQPGKTEFSLVFKSLPKNVKKVDFVEGDFEGAWKMTGISLDPNSSKSTTTLAVTEPNLNDIVEMLERYGFKNYTFDLTAFQDRLYKIKLSIREYEGKTMIREMPMYDIDNFRRLSSINEESQKRLLANGDVVSQERDIWQMCTDRLSIRFLPQNRNCDSLQQYYISARKQLSFNADLELRPSIKPNGEKSGYHYESIAFEKYEMREREFCPLVALACFWYDAEYGIFRFCGGITDILERSPHHYEIGLIFTRVE